MPFQLLPSVRFRANWTTRSNGRSWPHPVLTLHPSKEARVARPALQGCYGYGGTTGRLEVEDR